MRAHSFTADAAALLSALLIAGCAATLPQPPAIDRLPEGTAGPLPPARSTPLSLEEVVSMARNDTPSNVIIQTLRDTRATYAISADEARSLERRGVPPDVAVYLRGGDAPAARAMAMDPYAYPAPYPPYYAPYYGPYAPYGWGYPRVPGYSAPWYRGGGVHFGFGRRW